MTFKDFLSRISRFTVRCIIRLKKYTAVFCRPDDVHVARKREWGTEWNLEPLSHLHKVPSGPAIFWSRVAVVVTLFFWMLYVTSVIMRQLIDGPKNYQFMMESLGYLTVVTFLTFSALVYLITRQGALQRFSRHVRVPRAVLDTFFSKHQSSITVLVPSLGEETAVIRKTLLSAALQEYPQKRVVLLIDDDAKKLSSEHRRRLEATRSLAHDIEAWFSEPRQRFKKIRERFSSSSQPDEMLVGDALREIATHYMEAAQWLEDAADREVIEDHVDVFFADQVLRGLAGDLRHVAKALLVSAKQRIPLSFQRALELHERLVWIFSVKMEVFERKQYISLSHEKNKAMNLNAYIGLMGGQYSKEATPDGVVLLATDDPAKADLVVPDSDFLLTLDADSILLREYCLRLVYLLEQPDNADVAVTQTPYSSFRGSPTRIERLAGATTDIQHILHQGMSYYNATFWVGANAVIRKRALLDIVEKEWVGGFEVKRYIQDRTVIEDTESSIDLALHGWRLVNYPERLSYSATPPDFGSLIIQRRRWANGGLIILPKLFTLQHERKLKGQPMSKMEFLIRLNYMASIAWSNIGLVFLLTYPYDGRLLSSFIFLAALPYFIAMAVDLKHCRYSYSDIIRIYGFNLILLPVNIAGTFKSLEQMLTTKKLPFARTPKVKNRTAAGFLYVASPLLIIGFCLFTLWHSIEANNWGNALAAGFNSFAALWAVFAYIGMRGLIEDLWYGFTEWFYVDAAPQDRQTEAILSAHPDTDWHKVLHPSPVSGFSSSPADTK